MVRIFEFRFDWLSWTPENDTRETRQSIAKLVKSADESANATEVSRWLTARRGGNQV
jgi:hypothetical protein